MQNTEFVSSCLENFQKVTKQPEDFLQVNEDLTNNIKNQLKEIYDFSKNEEIKKLKSNALPELIVKDFDLEQIWQQLELQNESLLPWALNKFTKLEVQKDKLLFKNLVQENAEEEEESINEDIDEENDLIDDEENYEQSDAENSEFGEEEEGEEEEEENVPSSSLNKESKKKSIVDDNFFKLEEMEQFLKAEEQKMEDPDSGNDSENDDDEDDEDIDLLEDDVEVDDNARQAKYKDFFVAQEKGKKKEKRNKFLEAMMNDDKEEDDGEEEFKSTFEQRQERLQRKIGELEEKAIGEKPWQLKGEITAESRPQNSLLEEVLEFDLTTRPAPIITEKTTLQLEDIIRQRIKDKVFDSVERKEKPVESLMEYKKKLVLNQEKSKESLAQIYEKEYLEQKANLDPANEEKEEEEPEAHKEINKLMTELFNKLDALSNFHFTPKPSIPELKIISNIPAINMEEVAPIGVSDANLLAPEEVKSKPKGDIIGKAERTDTDKKRERRKKKLKQKFHAKIKAKKEVKATEKNKLTKVNQKNMLNKVIKSKNVNKMEETADSKSTKSSKAFFTQLEEEVKTQIKNKLKVKKRNNNDNERVSAKKMKL